MHRLVLVAQNRLGILATEDRSGSRIDGPASILFEAVMDLALVSIHVFAGNAAEEDPRVDVLGQRQRVGLQAKVRMGLQQLDVSATTLELDRTGIGKRRLDLTCWLVPIALVGFGQYAVTDGSQTDIPELDGSFAKLQSDLSGRQARGVFVVSRLLPIDPDLDMILID